MIFMAGGNAYELVHEHKTAWNPEAFRERFSEVLERYDYIVGDWGYNQLRLKGFFKEGHSRSTKDSTIASLVDYINEYCNFGCAYFVLTKLDAAALPPGTELTDLESAAASAAASEGAEPQTAEAAVAPTTTGGILMRWPLKERPGGPVRTPSMSAISRAVAESAERRNANAGGSQSGGRSSSDGRQSGYGGGNRQDGGNRQGGRSNGSYYQGQGDRRQGGGGGGQASGGAGEGRGGKPSYQQQRERGPRQQGGDRNVSSGGQPRPQQQERAASSEPQRGGEAAVGAPRGDAAKSGGGGGRWGPSGKNRRRQRYGGKPNHQEGSHSPEPGKPGGE